MRNLLIALFLVFSSSAQAVSYTCSLQEWSTYRGAGKVLANSMRSLDVAEIGIIPLQIVDGIGPDGQVYFYEVSSFRVRENGCQEMFVRTGLKEDPHTWNNVFTDWCADGELSIYNPLANDIYLYCMAKQQP
jgi:hypothetical protein